MVFTSTIILAQPDFRYAPGVNFSSLRIKQNGIKYGSERPMTIHIGGQWEMMAGKHLWIDPGFQFSAKGSDYEIDSVKKSLTPLYIEIPVNAEYRFSIGNLSFSFFSGVFFGCAVGGYMIDDGKMEEISFGSGEHHDMRRLDWGLNLGTGIGVGNAFVAVQYSRGFANFSPVRSGDSEMKSDVIGVSLIFR
jgi:hypothetical protein